MRRFIVYPIRFQSSTKIDIYMKVKGTSSLPFTMLSIAGPPIIPTS